MSPMLSSTDETRNPVSQPRALEGSIAAVPLPDLIQLLSNTRRTGALRVTMPQEEGLVLFTKGQIHSAVAGDREGLAALKAMSLCRSGSFRFNVDDIAGDARVRASNAEILLELCRFTDERDNVEAALERVRERLGAVHAAVCRRRGIVLETGSESSTEEVEAPLAALSATFLCTDDLLKATRGTQARSVVFDDDETTTCFMPIRSSYSLALRWRQGRMPDHAEDAVRAASEEIGPLVSRVDLG